MEPLDFKRIINVSNELVVFEYASLNNNSKLFNSKFDFDV